MELDVLTLWFERISMMVILLNCVTLGMYQPCQDEVCNTHRCRILQMFDDLIFAFFAIEMVIKVLAMGFWGKGTYLAETWNRLDCFIVVAGFTEYCLDMENMNLSAIRTIRVLRPLRAINRIPSMRILVMLLLDTLPMLGNVLLLCFFVFFIFGIVGVQLWAGLLRQRCYFVPPENMSTLPSPLSAYYQDVELEKDYICSLPKDVGMHRCEYLPPTRYNGMICNSSFVPYAINEQTNTSCINYNQYYTKCSAGDRNPFQGAISFDNIGLAWVAIFLVISLEGWTDIMYYVQDAHSFWNWIYFVLLIVIGSFFMINLCLVVIATQFSETKKREMERMRMERARYQSTSTLASNSMSEPTSCYSAIIKYIAHLWRRARRKAFVYYKNFRSNREIPTTPKAISLHRKRRRRHLMALGQNGEQTSSTSPGGADFYNGGSPPAPRASPEVSDIDPVASPRHPLVLRIDTESQIHHSSFGGSGGGTLLGAASTTEASAYNNNSSSSNNDNNGSTKRSATASAQSSTNNHIEFRPSPLSRIVRGRGASQFTCQELLVISGAKSAALAATLASGCNIYSREKQLSAPQLLFYPLIDPIEPIRVNHSEGEWSDSETGYDLDDWHSDGEKHTNCVCFILRKIRKGIKFVVDSTYFQRGILLAILVNTLSMGIEYHNQPDELTVIVETSNVVFSAIFAFEMLLKLIAEGPFKYISNGFNVFDGVIVILSLVELLQKSEGSSGLSVLRTFRLLRILKLVRFMPALRRQLFVMLRTMDNVAVFFALLILFIFIFSILGMNLFGCKFCKKLDDGSLACERKNFDSLLWAIVTVFQILTQEDWNVVLFNGMEKTSHWAALYFVALMTFGNYVLFNLLVAILVEGFSAERHESECEEKHAALKELEKQNKEEKKSSNESLSKLEDSKKDVKEIDFKKKELEKLKQLEDDSDPKCNIKKETRMLQLPPSVAITKSDKQDPKTPDCPLPPIITHTAATPQGSPNATLEPAMRDLGSMLSPALSFNRSATSLDTIDKTSQSSALSIPSLSNSSSHMRSSNTQLSVRFGGTQTLSPQLTRRGSFSPSSESSNLLRKDSLSPSPCRLQRKGSHGSATSSSPRLQRRESRGSVCNWRRRSRRHGDQETLMDSDMGSEEDPSGEHEESILNNSNLNNHHSVSPVQDRSHCNGGLPTLQNNPNYKRNILAQQNTIGTTPMTLSPQNSIRSRPTTPRVAPSQTPASSGTAWHVPGSRRNSIRNPLSRQNSMNGSPQNSISHRNSVVVSSRHNSLTGSEFKHNNLDVAQSPLNKALLECKEERENGKMCWFFEPPPQLLEREEYSLFIFPNDNPFREGCLQLTEKKWFDYGVLVFIALNCITLAMERPTVPPSSAERLFLQIANYIFTVVFAMEMAVKVVAWGLWYGKDTYFRSGWNVMDGSLVIVSLVDIVMSIYSSSSPRIFGILRVFRLLRSLRPLRVINRAPGLKLVVQTLLSSLRPIGNIVLICCTFFIIFGILGVQLFKGTFFYCDGPNVKNVHNRSDCMKDSRNMWLNRKYNFDDLGQALMSLFVLSSKDGWVNIMYQGLDAVGVDQQPIENFSEWRLLYFISFLLLVGFFVLNMFVGVVVENFHRCREEQEREEKARRAEKRARKMEKKRRKMRDPPYYINYSRPRLFIHNIVTSKYFDLAIAAVIGLNVVTMAMEFYMMPVELIYTLEIFNYFFTAVFVLEAGMKMFALGAARYFSDKWNQLDVGIVMMSVVGIVLEKMESAVIPINPTIIRVMRVLRIARVLKLLKMAKGIRALLDTVMQALPQVGNLGLLFFLLFFIFAALGVELFGRLECDELNPCQGLGEHAHFQNFGMAFLTLFRVATGDNWNGIMKDTLRDSCDSSADCVRNCCVSPLIAPLYFVVFVLMAQFVLVNVVVAVLMKHLEESHKHMEDEIELEDELERELAAEEEAAAGAAAAKAAAEQNKEHICGTRQYVMFPHKPIYKISSLPANFTFSLHSEDIDSPPGSPSINGDALAIHALDPSNQLSTSVETDLNEVFQPVSGVIYDDANNVNIRQASPEEPVNKVAVADLRTISPVIMGSFPSLKTLASPSPSRSRQSSCIGGATNSDSYGNSDINRECLSLPNSQWSVDHTFSLFPHLRCGDGVATSLSLTSASATLEAAVAALSPDISPECNTGKTEGSNVLPPPYQSVVRCPSIGSFLEIGHSDQWLAAAAFPHSLSHHYLYHLDQEEPKNTARDLGGTLEDLCDVNLFEEVTFEGSPVSRTFPTPDSKECHSSTPLLNFEQQLKDQSVVPFIIKGNTNPQTISVVDSCIVRGGDASPPISISLSTSSTSSSSSSLSSSSSASSSASSVTDGSPSSSHRLLDSPKSLRGSCEHHGCTSTPTTTTTTSSEIRDSADDNSDCSVHLIPKDNVHLLQRALCRGKQSPFRKHRCHKHRRNVNDDEECTFSSLNLSLLVGENNSLIDDSLSSRSVWDVDEPLSSRANIVEAEDVLIVDPTDNKIVCIYDGCRPQESMMVMESSAVTTPAAVTIVVDTKIADVSQCNRLDVTVVVPDESVSGKEVVVVDEVGGGITSGTGNGDGNSSVVRSASTLQCVAATGSTTTHAEDSESPSHSLNSEEVDSLTSTC